MTSQAKAAQKGYEDDARKESMILEVFRQILKNPTATAGMIVFLLICLIAIFAPLVAPYSPTEMDLTSMYATPSMKHLLGCDEVGRDILSRLIYGARYSLSIGLIADIGSQVIGVLLGCLIGYAGGKVDMIAMRVVDVWLAIPSILLAVMISTILGSGYVNTIIAMLVSNIPGGIRSSRAMCLREREMDYLEAARSINCSRFRIMYIHMVPNIISPTIVGTTMGIGSTIMTVAGLAYIGLGIQPPTPEWGAMLSAGRNYIMQYPHMITSPGVAIAITVLALNMFGDGLRDALDPKMKN
ncbi:MAG: ABC transporter permease [Lachnospiraceae bacterium]|nr:ABC transporter permease [Lachnospiraceae bacterium]